jgi:hypothetical protein
MKKIYISSLVFELGYAVCGATLNSAIIFESVVAGSGGRFTPWSPKQVLQCNSCPLNYWAQLVNKCSYRAPCRRGLRYFVGWLAIGLQGFHINLSAAAIAPIDLTFLPLYNAKDQSIWKRVTNLDLLGCISNTATWEIFAIAASAAGLQWPCLVRRA